METEGGRQGRGPQPAGERTALIAAVMALTVVAGVGVVLVFPKPETGAPPVELARPAPVASASTRAWPLLAPPAAAPAPTPAPEVRTAEARPPPLRTRRLEMAQAARPHPERAVRMIPAKATPQPPAFCRAPQSAADRLVCARPTLAAQDREMRQAYDRALAAGADRLAVDRAQAKWRGRRDRATTERELSQLYADRIAELDRTARIRSPGGALDL